MLRHEQAIYFLYSFAFLLTRSLAVSLIASKVHTASRVTAEYLYDVPSSTYCNEVDEMHLIRMTLAINVLGKLYVSNHGFQVQRFLNQIYGDEVALTGLQFFNVKRGLVLTVSA